MASEVQGLHESQIKALGDAKAGALLIHGYLHKFLFGLREKRPPHMFVDAIAALLGYRYDNPLPNRLETIGFFIEQVRIPVKVPWFACAEKVTVLSSNCPSAHEGAVRLWDAVRSFLQSKVFELCPECGLIHDPWDAAKRLMPHCDNLRRDLGDAIEYDLDALAKSIKQESQAAMEVCNASAFSAVAGRIGHSETRSELNAGAEKPAGSTPVQSVIPSGAAREAVLQHLEPAVRKAYLAFQYAETFNECGLEDREAHSWLCGNGIDPAKDGFGELTDYEVPDSFETFRRYVTAARKPLGESKYTPRGGRHRGRSIVHGDEIEHQRSQID